MSRPTITTPTGEANAAKHRAPARLQEQIGEEDGSDEGSVGNQERTALSPRVPLRVVQRASSPASGAGNVTKRPITPQPKITERASSPAHGAPSQSLREALGRRMSSRSSIASSQLLERIRSTSAAGQRVTIDLTKIGTMDLQVRPAASSQGVRSEGVKSEV